MHKTTIHRRLSLFLQFILLLGALIALWNKQWLTAAMTIGIILLTLFPLLVKRRYQVFIPPEFAVLAIGFVFAALYLGEVRGFYGRFWWWDMALHTASGFLLGMLGFLLVYILNETEEIDLHMRPGFVALFAFVFAVGLGAVWEIFEFSMDQFFGLTMQKPMFDDPSGLTDTMWDLIVDTLGAAVIALLGYGYLKTARNQSFLERWIQSFIQANPRLFKGNRTEPPQ